MWLRRAPPSPNHGFGMLGISPLLQVLYHGFGMSRYFSGMITLALRVAMEGSRLSCAMVGLSDLQFPTQKPYSLCGDADHNYSRLDIWERNLP